MNRDTSGRYMLVRPRNICPKTALNLSSVTQFANWEFHAASFISNHVIFARDLQVSGGEAKNGQNAPSSSSESD